MMKSKKYWERRAEKRMYEYQNQADLIANDIAQAYISATNEINEEIKKIFHTFQIDGGLSENEAYKLLNNLPDSVKLSNLKAVVSHIKNLDKRREILNIINAPAYAYRIRRLEALQQDIDEKTNQLADIEQNITKEHYIDLANTAYTRSIFDIQKGTGFLFSFSSMPLSRIEEILRMNWSGQLFSKRIWGNTADLNQKIKQELLAGFMTGRSYAKTAAKIQEQMQVRAWEARRLVRTESTYIANMAELESYKECGIKKYRFVATLDLRTSDICRGMDGKEFSVDDAMPGKNLPPLHPWCRSTTIAVIDGVVTDGLKRRARDPKTGKTYLVPDNMTYKEWKKTIVEKYGKESVDIEQKKIANLNKDIEQHARYRSVLGNKVPKSIAQFQDMKYNNIKEWDAMKRNYKLFNQIDSKDTYSPEYKQKLKDTYLFFKENGFEFTEHALGRVVGQKKKRGIPPFTNDELLSILKKEPNYIQDDGRIVRYYGFIAAITAPDTGEVVSIVTRDKINDRWKGVKR